MAKKNHSPLISSPSPPNLSVSPLLLPPSKSVATSSSRPSSSPVSDPTTSCLQGQQTNSVQAPQRSPYGDINLSKAATALENHDKMEGPKSLTSTKSVTSVPSVPSVHTTTLIEENAGRISILGLHDTLPSATANAPTKTWCDLFQGTNKKMKKKGKPFLLESGEACVAISNDVIQRNKHRWSDFIIAQFHGNAPSPGALHAIANSMWSPKLRNVSVSRISIRAYLIKIPCPATRKRVLSQGMWHVEKQAMFVAKWEPGLQPEIPELKSAPVWLEFRNVPPHFFSEEGLEHIAGILGDPLFLHPSTSTMTNLEVAKVYTVIDPTKPLPEAVNVKFDSGHIHRIEVSSPWLPPLCEHCKEVGHIIRQCPTAPITCTSCKSTSHTTEKCPRAKKKHVPPPAQHQATEDKSHEKAANTEKQASPATTIGNLLPTTRVHDSPSSKTKIAPVIVSSQATPMKIPGLSNVTPTREENDVRHTLSHTSTLPPLDGTSLQGMSLDNACGVMSRDDGTVSTPESSDTDIDSMVPSSQMILRDRPVPSVKYNENEWISVTACRRSKRSRGLRGRLD